MKFNQINFDMFCREFGQQIIRGSEEDGTTHEDKFTELVLDALEEADETENTFIAYHKKIGIKVNGYGINESGEVLDLFVSEYLGQIPAVSIPKSETESAFKRVENFFEKSVNGYYRFLEEAQPVYDLSDRIFKFSSEFRKIRFFLLTDKTSRLEEIKEKKKGDFTYTYQVWDIGRYHNLVSSGKSRESITLKLKDEFNSLLPCLNEGGKNSVYTSYLAVIPGKTLVNLYEEFGPRLLERNVRSFLQVRGNVNKGIKNTILKDPEMFLAYNNGLSTTAEEITVEVIDGRTCITQIRDFQIVNGAQTTATIHDTYMKNKNVVDLESIYVPMKLTVLKDSSELNEFVPKISQYSNTQNKIDMADFSSNHPFHIKMEEISARVRAPSKEGIQLESYWFYERVRGQYLNERNREMTPARKKIFDKVYPKKQKIEKTELPVFEHTWQMKPWEVSLGKQKNYKLFMNELASGDEMLPDEKYFTNAVAKAILYKETYSIVRKELEGGYRPNIVTYAIAYLNYKTGNKISLDKIWKEQDICDELRNVLSQLVKDIQKFIISAPEGRNVTEFCKKKECWDKLRSKKFKLAEDVSVAFSDSEKAESSPYPPEELNRSKTPVSVCDSAGSQNYGDKHKVEYNKSAEELSAALVSSSDPEFSFPSSVKESSECKVPVNIAPSDDWESLLEDNAGSADNLGPVFESPEKTKPSGSFIKRPSKTKPSAPSSVGSVSQKDWEKIAEWGQDTENLDSEQQDVATRFASGVESGSYRSPDLMLEGLVVLNIAKEKGFEFFSSSKSWPNKQEKSSEPIEKKKLKAPKHSGVWEISDEMIKEEIIQILTRHFGKCKLSVINKELEKKWEYQLYKSYPDQSIFGFPRWRSRISSIGNQMNDEGTIETKYPEGIWILRSDLNCRIIKKEKEKSPPAYVGIPENEKNLRANLSDDEIEDGIVRVLVEHGGFANLSDTLSDLEDMWKDKHFNAKDLKKTASGTIKWRSRVLCVKNNLVEKGILDKNTPVGRLKLDDALYKSPRKYESILKDNKN